MDERRRLLLGFGAVALVAVGHAAHDAADGDPVWRAALSGAVIIGQCAVLTAAHSRAVLRNASRASLLTAYLLVGLGFGVLFSAAHSDWGVARWMGVGAGLLVGLAVVALWALVFRLPAILDLARLQALEAENLRREAELARLRVHLHPHFLLNTLNAVAGLVTEDPGQARHVLATLGDLVRDALAEGDEVRPFGEDLAWLRRYAEILELRHRGVLSFRWEIAPETLAVRIPHLLLQPLVENAVRHGALRRPEGGSVLVRSEMTDDGRVRFVVEDDGPGIAAAAAEGLGLRLVRRRLALACSGGRLDVAPSGTGTVAVVEIRAPGEARS